MVLAQHPQTRPRIGLALGSGVARGWAHLGVIRALSRHGIDVTAEALPTAGIGVGEAMLSHASDLGADLLVMGAYGHSRTREYVFGGATRTIFDSMTVPVLMSH